VSNFEVIITYIIIHSGSRSTDNLHYNYNLELCLDNSHGIRGIPMGKAVTVTVSWIAQQR